MAYGTLQTDVINSSTGLFSTNNAYSGIAKAWVNFNGTSGSVAIRSSMNVSSITYNGTGTYTVNFTTAMPNTNYAIVAGQQIPSNASSNAVDYPLGNITTSSYQTVFYQSAVPRDNALMMQAVFSL
jgi:hypothetical protein